MKKILKGKVMPDCHCLNCDHNVNRAAAVDDDISPSPGDATICLYCSHIMIFTDDMGMRNPNDEELSEIERSGDYQKMLWVARQFQKKMKSEKIQRH
jgi:hypothetical protein